MKDPERLLALVLILLSAYVGYFLGRSVGIAETKALWRTQEFPAPEDALWDKSTYDKAVAEEVERQKEMPRGR